MLYMQKFLGTNCDVTSGVATWEVLSSPHFLAGRASHSAIVVNNYMYILGGDHFASDIFLNMIRYNFLHDSWESVTSNPTKFGLSPDNRYDHSSVLFEVSLCVLLLFSLLGALSVSCCFKKLPFCIRLFHKI